jgi:CO/xanthine dehydrogenase FAD-binding subunit
MDLHNIENYLHPSDINKITDWGEGWSWLAGGTWLFSEPQPQITNLVDIQSLGWHEIEVVNPPNFNQGGLNDPPNPPCEGGLNDPPGNPCEGGLNDPPNPPCQGGLNLTPGNPCEGGLNLTPGNPCEGGLLAIGATCSLIKLLEHPLLAQYTALKGFESAISALSASLKVVNVATVGGNICLALSVGTLAPIMVALDASYEILNLKGESRIVAARDFQIGCRQTVLQSGELLRRVLIPVENMNWQVDYKRFGSTASDPALAIVCGAYNKLAKKLRLVIGASVTTPRLLEFDGGVETDFDYVASVENMDFIEDARASALYRRQITEVLIRRCLVCLDILGY